MTWDEYGRLGVVYNSTVGINAYQYDTNGLRTFKRSKNVNHYYYYDGDRLIAEKLTTGYLLYHYDENDSIFAITYNNGTYEYTYQLLKNLQGDVVAILNAANNVIATYEYDAWGNLLSIKNEYGNDITNNTGYFANINPIRYRGYYYDTETGFYYLKSRYYDPANCRFISADDSGFCESLNFFSYCMNKPVQISVSTPERRNTSDYQYVSQNYEVSYEIPEMNFKNDSNSASASVSILSAISPFTIPNINIDLSSIKIDIKCFFRDVTNEVNAALFKAANWARSIRNYVNKMPFPDRLGGEIGLCSTFYSIVNHGALWDIKRQIPWETTIGTTFPGYGSLVVYRGRIMTPEAIGNFTYGYLGFAFGFSYQTLLTGSFAAAGFPMSGPSLDNEFGDWDYIVLGYLYAMMGC